MKKVISLFTVILVLLASSVCVGAKEMNMYINNKAVTREIETVGAYDMLPITDIMYEMGFETIAYDGSTLVADMKGKAYTFRLGNASVYDHLGNWYGLDVVPQYINGKYMLPYNFFTDVLGMTYTWDSVTNTLFINSDYTYNWLINTAEYRTASFNNSIPKYSGTNIPDYGLIIGASAFESGTTNEGYGYYWYYSDANSFNNYVKILQNCGWNYYQNSYSDGIQYYGFSNSTNQIIVVGIGTWGPLYNCVIVMYT